jgi:predicted CxxxxCH...CXXCH cytochrome family protein
MHGAFVGEGVALCSVQANLYCHGEGEALAKRLGLGVSKVDWTTTFHFVVEALHEKRRRLPPASGLSVQGSGYRVQGSRFRAQGIGFRVQGPGCRVQGAGFRVQGSQKLSTKHAAACRQDPSILNTSYSTLIPSRVSSGAGIRVEGRVLSVED